MNETLHQFWGYNYSFYLCCFLRLPIEILSFPW
mgnify:CR=1 FL=1